MKTTLNNFYSSNILYDPLEQFERGSWIDFYPNIKIILFVLVITLFIHIGEIFEDFFIQDIFLENIVSDLFVSVKNKSFFFILFPLFILMLSANLAGLFFFSFTETAQIQIVFLFSFLSFFAILVFWFDKKRFYILHNFLPYGTPPAILKLLITIEVVSYTTRLISLALRLLANMISGHILIKILITFVWIAITAAPFLIFLAIIPWVFIILILCLEILIAFLQSYVFAFLVVVFIKEIES